MISDNYNRKLNRNDIQRCYYCDVRIQISVFSMLSRLCKSKEIVLSILYKF